MIQSTTVSTPARTEPAGPADITGRADILALLRDFYGRAFSDELLGPVFVDVARMDLDIHLPVICDFWDTVLFHAGSYRRNALAPHQRLSARAELTPEHFARWLALWCATVDDRFDGPKSGLAKLQGRRMAGAMSRRITGTADLGGTGGPEMNGGPRRSCAEATQRCVTVTTAQPEGDDHVDRLDVPPHHTRDRRTAQGTRSAHA